LQRTKGYAEKGIHVFWIFGEENWFWKKVNMEKVRDGIDEKKVNVVEKKLHQLNYGRVYYAQYWLENKDLQISAYHFNPVVRVNDPCENCWWEENVENWDGDCDDRCWVYAKGLNNMQNETVLKSVKKLKAYEPYFETNISFVLFENEGYKLARLTDPYFWGDSK